MGTYTPVAGYSSFSYASSTVPAHGVERACFYTPDTTRFSKPPGGWPVAVAINYAGFASTYLALTMSSAEPPASVFEEMMTFLLDNGVAIVNAAILPCYSDDVGFAVGPPPPTVGAPVDLTYSVGNGGATAYGNAPYGKGVFIPFEIATPTDYSGSVAYGHPSSDPLRSNGYRDVAMLFQYIWTHADVMGINRNEILDLGGSAAADVLAYSSWAPNRASQWFPTAAAGTQDAAPTRITRASIFTGFQPWMPVFQGTVPIICFPRKVSLGGSTLYDTASLTVTESTTTHVRNGSMLFYALDSGIIAKNRSKPLYVIFTTADGAGSPWTTAKTNAATDPHDSWGGSALIDNAAFPDNAVFYMGSNNTNNQNDGVILTTNGAGVAFKNNGLFFVSVLSWLDNTVHITRLPKRSRWSLRK